MLNDIALGNHALFKRVIILLLDTSLIVARCAGPDGSTGNRAACGANGRAMTTTQSGTKARAEDRAADTF